MDYTVDLLKKHGIEEIAVTLAYLPGAIKDYFEDGQISASACSICRGYPLGCRKCQECSRFLPETFVVISGDALTDLDISKAVAFHKERGSLATLVCTGNRFPDAAWSLPMKRAE